MRTKEVADTFNLSLLALKGRAYKLRIQGTGVPQTGYNYGNKQIFHLATNTKMKDFYFEVDVNLKEKLLVSYIQYGYPPQELSKIFNVSKKDVEIIISDWEENDNCLVIESKLNNINL
jgi:hypothetical protein